MTLSPDLLECAKGGDKESSEELIRQNSGLIWSVARRFFGRGVEADDLYQLGCIGFLKAIQGFDTEYGTCFSTYAVPKIAGEIRRFLRDDGPVKISRTVKERAFTVRSARTALQQKLGREPVLSELAAETGFTPEDIAACEIASVPAQSLQAESGEDGFTLESVLGNWEEEASLIERFSLRQAISALPPRERAVIHLRYYRGMTQSSAAKILNVSQVQVSRIEKKAVNMLREQME